MKLKTYKILEIIFTVLCFIPWAFLMVAFILAMIDQNIDINPYVRTFVYTGIAVIVLYFVMGIFSIIFSVFVKESPSKLIMILKICLIPIYATSFIFFVFLCLGMLNPFTMIGIPFIVFFGIVGTYAAMIRVSLPLVVWAFKSQIKRRTKYLVPTIIFTICLFVFVLDVAGAIGLYVIEKKQAEDEKNVSKIVDATIAK